MQQHGLCAYCEIDLGDKDRLVGHFAYSGARRRCRQRDRRSLRALAADSARTGSETKIGSCRRFAGTWRAGQVLTITSES